MIDFSDPGSPDPLKRDLAYVIFLEEALGPEWVERWARSVGSSMCCASGGRWCGDLPQSRKSPKEKRASQPWTSPHLFPNLFPWAAVADVENAVSATEGEGFEPSSP